MGDRVREKGSKELLGVKVQRQEICWGPGLLGISDMHREKGTETNSGGPQALEALGKGVDEGRESVQEHAEL